MTDEIDAELSEIEQLKAQNTELKHVVGRQGNEIGDLRKMIETSLPKEDDWDYDPQQKEIRELKSTVGQMQQAEQLRQLESEFPGFRELPKNKEFTDWVTESKTRSELLYRADNMDLGAAREVLSLWKERERLKEDLQVQGNSQRRQALKAASMEKGSAGGVKTNYYSRKELQDMRWKDPARFAREWDDIKKAYEEGRVR